MFNFLKRKLRLNDWYNVDRQPYTILLKDGGDIVISLAGNFIKLNVHEVIAHSYVEKFMRPIFEGAIPPINSLEFYDEEYLRKALQDAEEKEDFESCQRIKNELNERIKKRK